MGIEEIKRALKVIAPYEGMRVEKHLKIIKSKKAGVSDEQRKFLIAEGYMNKGLNLTAKGRELL